MSPATGQAYGTYWRRIADEWGGRRLHEVTASEIRQLAEQTRTRAVVRRNSAAGTAPPHI